MEAANQVDREAAQLRDHRPLLCNADDYGRMCAVPKEKGANFRDMPGVVTRIVGCGKEKAETGETRSLSYTLCMCLLAAHSLISMHCGGMAAG
jgi:hypothetical protein